MHMTGRVKKWSFNKKRKKTRKTLFQPAVQNISLQTRSKPFPVNIYLFKAK